MKCPSWAQSVCVMTWTAFHWFTFSGDVGIRMVFSNLEKGCWMLSNMLDSSTLVDLKHGISILRCGSHHRDVHADLTWIPYMWLFSNPISCYTWRFPCLSQMWAWQPEGCTGSYGCKFSLWRLHSWGFFPWWSLQLVSSHTAQLRAERHCSILTGS